MRRLHKSEIPLLALAGLFACGLAGAQSTHSPSTVTLHQSGHPMAEVLDNIQNQFLVPITYEDAPYENDRDLPTHVTIVNGGRQKLLTGPPIVDFTVTFDTSDTSPYLAAQRLLATYISASLPGEYTVVQAAGRVDVVPIRVLGRDGRMRDVEPIMSSPITFPMGARPVGDTLQLLVQQVSKESGSKVILLDPLFWPTYTIQLSSDGQSAADLISAIGAQLRVPLSFRCFYDADEKAYYLRIQGVVPPNPPNAPASTKKASSTPQNSPWFYKAQ